MSIYTPCLDQNGDGLCGCGAPAVTEISVGWHDDGRVFGGQYEEMCQLCADAVAARHAANPPSQRY